MFAKLFAEAGLSLDRLRALVEVRAAGSIVKAAGGDPVKQSQVSRQIKELENFFQTRLAERHGKGIQLTAPGKELARISRFFLLGLSNFQKGCISEEQTFRIAASATFLHEFLLPIVSDRVTEETPRIQFALEVAGDDEIERRLHDLTLDFGIVTTPPLSRPLQTKSIGAWRLNLVVPDSLFRAEAKALEEFRRGRLPLALSGREWPLSGVAAVAGPRRSLECENFLNASRAVAGGSFAALLPDFLDAGPDTQCMPIPSGEPAGKEYFYSLAWNPRLLRLNPHATRRRDWLLHRLSTRMQSTVSRPKPQLRRIVKRG